MTSIVKLLVAAGLSLSVAGIASAKTAGYHCVNARNREVKGANTAQECKSPYRWVQATASVAKAKAKAKPRKQVASAKRHHRKKGHH